MKNNNIGRVIFTVARIDKSTDRVMKPCACCGKRVAYGPNFCFGCRAVICLKCVQKNGHIGNGAHKIGKRKKAKA